MHPALAALVRLGNCSCVTLPSYVRVGRLCIALPRRGPRRDEADQDKGAVGEADQDKGPVGEVVPGEGPVDLHPAERPSHGRLGPVPQRSRDCVVHGLSRCTDSPRMASPGLASETGKAERSKSSAYLAEAAPRPLFPTRFYLLHPCASRQLLLHCSTFRRPCRSPAPAALVHLTARDGGNAEGL